MSDTKSEPIPPANVVQGHPEPRAEHKGTETQENSLKPESGEGKYKQESDKTASFNDPSQYGSDLSPYTKWNNCRIWAGES